MLKVSVDCSKNIISRGVNSSAVGERGESPSLFSFLPLSIRQIELAELALIASALQEHAVWCIRDTLDNESVAFANLFETIYTVRCLLLIWQLTPNLLWGCFLKLICNHHNVRRICHHGGL